jgi:hypothetical protein
LKVVSLVEDLTLQAAQDAQRYVEVTLQEAAEASSQPFSAHPGVETRRGTGWCMIWLVEGYQPGHHSNPSGAMGRSVDSSEGASSLGREPEAVP